MTHNSVQTARHDEGYVLLEILVAVVILAMAAYVVTPLITRGTGNRDLQTAAVLLVSELRAAHASAIKASRAENVVLDAERHRLTWGTPVRMVSLPASVAMVIKLRSGGEAAHSVVQFHHDGSSNGAEIKMQLSRRTSTVVVDWLTGQTRIAARE